MGMIWCLKSLSDLSAYYLFAAPVAACFGGSMLFWCMLLQGVAYGLSRCFGKAWQLIAPVGILGACFWLCWENPAELVALLPATGYLFLQFLKNMPIPELLRQRELFEDSWKLLLGSGVLALLLSQMNVWLPFLMMALMANMGLLRGLRHSPSVYLRPGFQAMNLGIVAIVPVGAFLLGTGPVWDIFFACVSWVYRQVILPVLTALLWLPGKLMQLLIDWLRPLFDIEPDTPNNTLPMESAPEATENFTTILSPAKTSEVMRIVVLSLLALTAILGIVLLFRKMGRRSLAREQAYTTREERTALERKAPTAGDKGSSAVQAIRKHYRRFLKRYHKEGLPLRRSSTSGEIHEAAKNHGQLGVHSGRIRQIYIQARYGGCAAKEDVREMGKLCGETKNRT